MINGLHILAGCSKRPSSKAAADERTGGVAPGYVEDAFKARTPLAGFFSILLRRYLSLISNLGTLGSLQRWGGQSQGG
jgi:hypothetical protein